MHYHKDLVDMDTGEHIGEGYLTTPEEKQQQQAKQEHQIESYQYYKENILPLPGFLQQEYGDFIQTRYDPLLKTLDYDTATAFRFIYLSTFMSYNDGYITHKDHKVDKHGLSAIFGVSANAFTTIYKTLVGHQLIMCDDKGYYYINPDYCYRGSIADNKQYRSGYTRVFIDSIRELYSKALDSREHKLLGRLILVLPYVNIYHNVICHNIKEKEMEKLVLPNSAELDSILHVSTRNSDKKIKELLEITVGGRPAILNISHNQAKMYAVNPSIYYGGTNLSQLQELDGYFRAKGGLD